MWSHRPHWPRPSSISKTSSRANHGLDYYKYLMLCHPAVFIWPSRAVIITVIFLLASSRSTASTTSFTTFATSSTYSSKTATTATTATPTKAKTTTSTATLLLVRFHAPFSISLGAHITTTLALRDVKTSTTTQLKQTNDVISCHPTWDSWGCRTWSPS